MPNAALVSGVQRIMSVIPGGTALKRRLRNNVAACGLMYRLSTRRQGQGFTIVMYHRVLERPDPFYPWGILRPIFEAQLTMFRRFCCVLSLDEILDRLEAGQVLPPRCVALTFDDGYRDNYTLAWPLLKKYRLPATLFVAVQALDHGILWPDLLRHALRTTQATRMTLETLQDEPRTFELATESDRLTAVKRLDSRLKQLPNDKKNRVLDELTRKLLGVSWQQITLNGLMLSWNELKTMGRDGMTVGSHTLTHPILTNLSEQDAAREITASRQILEEQLGVPVRHFCYPNGQPPDFSPAIQQMVTAAGFRSACTTIPGLNGCLENRFALRRMDGSQRSLRELVRAMVESA